MNEYSDFNNQIPTPKLDPLLMGEVMGADAFSEGDWVLLRSEENKPTKVTVCRQDFVFVDQGTGESFKNTLVKYYPEELGYPLDHRFWSLHQKQSYLRCHFDRRLLERWEGAPKNCFRRFHSLKAFYLGIMISVIVLKILGFW
ncbi:hypothetical protein ACSYAD_29695 [Acaryochloris marina NIES-2412]|uniref:hypothetical protein n=1 Tax=Acaryochloris marina TaxID=155978 RepID=UPI00405A176E